MFVQQEAKNEVEKDIVISLDQRTHLDLLLGTSQFLISFCMFSQFVLKDGAPSRTTITSLFVSGINGNIAHLFVITITEKYAEGVCRDTKSTYSCKIGSQ